MASLAEAMFREASQNIRDTKPDSKALAQGIQQGAQLAQKQQQLTAQKQQLGQMKQQIKAKGIENVFKFLQTADKFQDKTQGLKMRKVGLGPTIAANGVEDIFPPELQEAMTTSDEVRQGMAVLQSKVQSGEMNIEEAVAASQDLGQILDLSALAEASKFQTSEKGKTARSEIVAGGQVFRQQIGIAAKKTAADKAFKQIGPKAVASKVAQEFAAYDAQGGRVALESNLESLEAAVPKLKKITTGSLTTKIPGLSSDAFQSIVNQEMLNIQNDARAAIMPLLRATLGSQFTEKEGERIFGTVFDPKAPPEENARRMTRKINELRETIQDKEAAFVRQGLLDPNEVTSARESQGKPGETNIDEATMQQLQPAYQQLIKDGKSPEEIFTLLKQAVGGSDAQINQLIKKFQIEGK